MDKLVLVALFTVAVFVSLALSGVAIYTFRLFTSHPTARQRFLRELLFVGSLFAAVIVSPYVFRIGVFTQYNTPTYRLVFIAIWEAVCGGTVLFLLWRHWPLRYAKEDANHCVG